MTASHDIGSQTPIDPRAGPSAGDGATPPVGGGATPPVGDGATPPGGDGAAPPVEKNQLARRSVTGFEVFGQSLAATGPTISIGTLAVVYLIAGQGTMWSYILATVVAVLVGYSIAQFARRTAAAGSLYTYMASGLARSTAFAGGWGLIFGSSATSSWPPPAWPARRFTSAPSWSSWGSAARAGHGSYLCWWSSWFPPWRFSSAGSGSRRGWR